VTTPELSVTMAASDLLVAWYAVHAIAPGAMLEIDGDGMPRLVWARDLSAEEVERVTSYLVRLQARGSTVRAEHVVTKPRVQSDE